MYSMSNQSPQVAKQQQDVAVLEMEGLVNASIQTCILVHLSHIVLLPAVGQYEKAQV